MLFNIFKIKGRIYAVLTLIQAIFFSILFTGISVYLFKLDFRFLTPMKAEVVSTEDTTIGLSVQPRYENDELVCSDVIYTNRHENDKDVKVGDIKKIYPSSENNCEYSFISDKYKNYAASFLIFLALAVFSYGYFNFKLTLKSDNFSAFRGVQGTLNRL